MIAPFRNRLTNTFHRLAKKLQGHFTVSHQIQLWPSMTFINSAPLQVILIDKKSFFVCLPSLPACVCDPDHMGIDSQLMLFLTDLIQISL